MAGQPVRNTTPTGRGPLIVYLALALSFGSILLQLLDPIRLGRQKDGHPDKIALDSQLAETGDRLPRLEKQIQQVEQHQAEGDAALAGRIAGLQQQAGELLAQLRAERRHRSRPQRGAQQEKTGGEQAAVGTAAEAKAAAEAAAEEKAAAEAAAQGEGAEKAAAGAAAQGEGAEKAAVRHAHRAGPDPQLLQAADVLRHFLRANATQLRASWGQQLAKQRPRGIVMGGGYLNGLANMFASLHVLRHHLGCTLPTAILYWGADKDDDVDPRVEQFFKGNIPDVEFLDLSKLPYPPYHRPFSPKKPNGGFAGYAIKAFALYHAPFQEVLVLDGDNIPLLDPSCLWEVGQYRQYGNLFWNDYWSHEWTAADTLDFGTGYQRLNLTDPWEVADPSRVRATESGEIMFNRARHWEVLEWLQFLTSNHDTVYQSTHFDTETFGIAFALAGIFETFQKAPLWPAMTLWSQTNMKGMLQLHPNGSALFHHHNIQKYSMEEGWKPVRASHVAPILSEDLAYVCVYPLGFGGEGRDMICPDNAVVDVPGCQVDLSNLPATQKRCSPDYNPDLPRGQRQVLPLFHLPPANPLTVVEEVADAGFFKFREAVRALGAEAAARRQL